MVQKMEQKIDPLLPGRRQTRKNEHRPGAGRSTADRIEDDCSEFLPFEKTDRMVCDGPDPPEYNAPDLTPPPRHELMNGNGEDSDDENEHIGYEPLPQGPEAAHSDHESDDDEDSPDGTTNDIPPIESMESVITRNVWNAPRSSTDPIQMDNERAQQVMSAMANFALPPASIPEWAQSITEDQWKQTLNDRIEKIKSNR